VDEDPSWALDLRLTLSRGFTTELLVDRCPLNQRLGLHLACQQGLAMSLIGMGRGAICTDLGSNGHRVETSASRFGRRLWSLLTPTDEARLR
jgi:hypothetical protein